MLVFSGSCEAGPHKASLQDLFSLVFFYYYYYFVLNLFPAQKLKTTKSSLKGCQDFMTRLLYS